MLIRVLKLPRSGLLEQHHRHVSVKPRRFASRFHRTVMVDVARARQKERRCMMPSWLSYRGRMGRGRYFLFTLVYGFIAVSMAPLIASVNARMGIAPPTWEAIVGFALCVWLWSIPLVKRLHDLGMPALYLLCLIVPLLNVYMTFILFFQAGTIGKNRYGDDPLQYKNRISQQGTQTVFITPPRWESWVRYVALSIALGSLILLYFFTVVPIRHYLTQNAMSARALINILHAWPLIPLLFGWFNFIGCWGSINRVVFSDGTAVIHVLGPFGKETNQFPIQKVRKIKSSSIVFVSKGKSDEAFLKRKYLSPELRERLIQLGKSEDAQRNKN